MKYLNAWTGYINVYLNMMNTDFCYLEYITGNVSVMSEE